VRHVNNHDFWWGVGGGVCVLGVELGQRKPGYMPISIKDNNRKVLLHVNLLDNLLTTITGGGAVYL